MESGEYELRVGIMLGFLLTTRQQPFDRIAGREELIDQEKLKSALNIKDKYLAGRIFDLIDKDNSGYIDRDEFDRFIHILSSRDIRSRLDFIMSLCDEDNDGYVSKQELGKLISACISDQSLIVSDRQLDALQTCIFKMADLPSGDRLSGDDFVKLLALVPDIDYQFDDFINGLLGTDSNNSSQRTIKNRIAHSFWSFKNKMASSVWFIFYLMANIFLFVFSMYSYAEQGASLSVQIARGGGACLNFNCALVLLPMSKTLLGKLRHTRLSKILPLDNLVGIHKGIVGAIVLFSIVHITAHFNNYILTAQNIPWILFCTLVGVTGLLAVIILVAMGYFSQRRNYNYERFLSIHQLYIPFLIAMLIHGPSFWQWLAPFALVFGSDLCMRLWRRRKELNISELKSMSDQVTLVRFKEHHLPQFYPGDYVKLKIPALSKTQWHPFTISAAPQSGSLDLHVRVNGNWTCALNNLSNKSASTSANHCAYIDGPYSAPTSSVYRSRVAILVAGGIGITPFASTLQSILLKQRQEQEDNINAQQQVIHFHWLNRSQKSYSWFIDLLQQADKQLGDRNFKLHIHLTSLTRSLSNIVMQIAFDVFWYTMRFDPLTGLCARTSAGRPNWDSVFSEAAREHPNAKVDVYFCGPKALGKSVRLSALKQGFYYKEEKFE
ncbi:EF-hand domain-containing protein [Agaribacterium sp. ZY112]|uniref:EF-hand domain-containing protein n=1 Tax=Agaribacterium sp. ZY112 TaxID=3233574 RepID=UPI003524342B